MKRSDSNLFEAVFAAFRKPDSIYIKGYLRRFSYVNALLMANDIECTTAPIDSNNKKEWCFIYSIDGRPPFYQFYSMADMTLFEAKCKVLLAFHEHRCKMIPMEECKNVLERRSVKFDAEELEKSYKFVDIDWSKGESPRAKVQYLVDDLLEKIEMEKELNSKGACYFDQEFPAFKWRERP
jgi:hypothetical protein